MATEHQFIFIDIYINNISMADCSKCKRQNSKVPETYTKCVPLMSDGRLFTNWTPRCAQVYKDAIGKSSYDARQYMINNAINIMKANAGQAYADASCGPCYENPDWNTGTMLPELNVQTCDARTCTFAPNNKGGLGLRREYWNPKMESEYQKRFLVEKEKEQQYFKSLQEPDAYDHVPAFQSL